MYSVKKTKLGQYQRGVSIIGVGCTRWMRILDDPETEGLTENELFGYAALEAMKDAGVTGKDVQYYFHGGAMPITTSDYLTANVQVGDWFGMRGSGSMAHSEACCTGYMALDIAVSAVASGKYDMVLTGAVDMGDTLYIQDKPAHMRRRQSVADFMPTVKRCWDRAYGRDIGGGMYTGFDDFCSEYLQRYDVSEDELDEAINCAAIANRYNASHNPLALHQTTWEEVAAEEGFDSADEYLKSFYNPKMSEFLRASGAEERCEGAAAVIVCPTELAYKYTDHPIEVLGTGNSVLNCIHPHWERMATEEATRQVYELTGVKPEDIDILYVNDFYINSQLLAAEVTGYLPEGEGWKYLKAGKTKFDGEKPINPGGGRTGFGHAHGASGMADVVDACRQLRGEAGDHQVKNDPKYAFLRGFGGGQNCAATILKKMEKEG